MFEMSAALLVEIGAVVTGLLYVILLMRENIWCWLFGIISSLLSIWLFWYSKLYAESFLYLYYVLMGIYGWYYWSKHLKETDELKIRDYTFQKTGFLILLGIIGTAILSFLFQKFTDAARPLVDSATTIFAFIATYLQTQKILSNWLFWIVINGVSVWLYYDRGLNWYAGLMGIYLVLSVLGYIGWQKKHKIQII